MLGTEREDERESLHRRERDADDEEDGRLRLRVKVQESIERRLASKQCLTYRKLWWVCMLTWVCVIVSAMVAVVYVLRTQPNIISVHLAKPTNEEGYRRLAYLLTDSADFCSLPVRMLMQPTCGAVALVGPDGVGTSLLRTYVEIGTRVTTGADKCMMSKTLHMTPTTGFRPLFAGECTDALYARHHALVRFSNSDNIDAMPGYDPTRFIYMWRHPLEAALSAYAKFLYCADLWRLDCLDRVPSARDLDSTAWEMFFRSYTLALAATYNESLAKPRALIVNYEEFGDRETAMAKVLAYIDPIVPLPSMSRMLRCISRQEDDRSKRHIDLKRDRDLFHYAYGARHAGLVQEARQLFDHFGRKDWSWSSV